MKNTKNFQATIFLLAVNIAVSIIVFMMTENIPMMILSMMFVSTGLCVVVIPDKIRYEWKTKKVKQQPVKDLN